MARILIIEDNPTNLQLVVYLLEAFGHQALGTQDGAEGIELARQQHPDLILIDIHMPKMDGYEVAGRLRDDAQCRLIPIIAVTALAMVGDREKLLASGFNGYISKPIDPESFPAKVQEFLQSPVAQKFSPEASPDPPAEPASPAPDNSHAVLLFVDNSATNLQLARSILIPQGYQVISAATVREGMGLARQNKPDLIVSDIHMPQQDGYDFIDLIRADPDLRKIPFVFLSSSIWSDRERERARAHGAAKLLTRPIESATLLGELEACLALRKAN
ncbi:MAG TPA: response regulator [Candidatus Sulfotelmatobacter sp.]